MHICTIFGLFASFFSAPVVFFSRSRPRGKQGGRLYTTAQAGSRAGSVARALGGPNREIWQVLTGLLSAELEPSKTMENQHAGHCCKAQKHGDINRFKLSSVIQLRTLLWACRPLLYMCGHDVCVYALCVCLCVLRVRVSVFTGPSMTHASAYLVVAC